MARAWQITVKGTQSGESVYVSLGIDGNPANPDSAFAAQEVATSVRDEWIQWIMPKCSDEYKLTSVEAVSVYSPQFAGVALAATSGGEFGPPLPTFTVARVRVATGLRGRAYQGRWGWPGMIESYTDDTNGNQLKTATAATLNTTVDAFFADLVASELYPAVISRVLNGAPRAVPLVTRATGMDVALSLGSRVSRRP
jgi:hypothetical protein